MSASLRTSRGHRRVSWAFGCAPTGMGSPTSTTRRRRDRQDTALGIARPGRRLAPRSARTAFRRDGSRMKDARTAKGRTVLEAASVTRSDVFVDVRAAPSTNQAKVHGHRGDRGRCSRTLFTSLAPPIRRQAAETMRPEKRRGDRPQAPEITYLPADRFLRLRLDESRMPPLAKKRLFANRMVRRQAAILDDLATPITGRGRSRIESASASERKGSANT